jgi:hypothetical protein
MWTDKLMGLCRLLGRAPLLIDCTPFGKSSTKEQEVVMAHLRPELNAGKKKITFGDQRFCKAFAIIFVSSSLIHRIADHSSKG